MKKYLRQVITARLVTFVILGLSTIAVMTACNKTTDASLPVITTTSQPVHVTNARWQQTYGKVVQLRDMADDRLNWYIDAGDLLLLPNNLKADFKTQDLNVLVTYRILARTQKECSKNRKVYQIGILEITKIAD